MGDGIRTRDVQIHNLVPESRKSTRNKTLHRESRGVGAHLAHDTRQTDPILAEVVENWNHLPDAVRAGILAMVRASRRN